MVAETAIATHERVSKDTLSKSTFVFEVGQLQQLIATLERDGFAVLGPTVRDGAIMYGPIAAIEDLPRGWTDKQAPGRYRIEPNHGDALFSYSVGPLNWKRFLHPADIPLWSAKRENGVFRILNNEGQPAPPQALLGVRACELAAITIQDRVLLNDRYRDPIYDAQRAKLFIVAVQCTRAAATCFCSSMNTGPAVGTGADLILTELFGSNHHRFLAKANSKRAIDLLHKLEIVPAATDDFAEAETGTREAAASQTRSIDTDHIRDLLYQNFDHPRWEAVATRCLTCANCTMVCPTCFCTTVEDASDVTGNQAERWRRWDSCFTQTFSYIHGGSIRTSSKARFRQWVTHKLAAWIDQFGTPGCVGCGRCITWCPVGIDITEEVRALREGGNNGDA